MKKQASPTIKQRKLASIFTRELMDNSGKNQGEILKEAGYAVTKNPYQVFEAEGTRIAILQELEKLGVNTKYKSRKLKYFLSGGKKKDDNLGFRAYQELNKMQGSYAPTKTALILDSGY